MTVFSPDYFLSLFFSLFLSLSPPLFIPKYVSAPLPVSYRGLLLLFDYLYRAIHTVHIIRKFVGRSAVNLPYVDLRLYGIEKSDSECCTNFKNFLMVRFKIKIKP